MTSRSKTAGDCPNFSAGTGRSSRSARKNGTFPISAGGSETAASTATIVGLKILEQLAARSLDRPVWLRVGQLIDGVSRDPIRDADVVFDAKEIKYVGRDGRVPDHRHLNNGQRAPDAVLADCTLLPALVEAHAHLFLDGSPVDARQREEYLEQPAEWMLARARARWPKILQTGVGAIRDAGDRHGVGLALAAAAKRQLGRLATTPWIDSPGAAIHRRGRYGSFMAEPIEEFENAADCVAARVAAGADRIKLLASGIINFKLGRVMAPPQLSAVEVATLVDAARGHGRQTFAHASGTEGIENSIEGGVTTVEHGFFISDVQLAKMRDRRIAWVPTIAPVQLQIDRAAELGWSSKVVAHLQRIIAGHQKMLCRADDLGIAVLAGSDAGSCGVPHGLGLLEELCHLEQAGLSPMTVLRSATGTSAKILALPEPIGRIVPGCRARFILTEHDPLQTVANLKRSKVILFDGAAIRCGDELDPSGL